MAQAESSVVIDRPLEQVFAYAADLYSGARAPGLPEWRADGPIQVGATVTQTRKFLGRRVEGELVCTHYELNRKVAFKVTSGPVPGEGCDTFEGVDGGTRVTSRMTIAPRGLFKLAGPIVARALKREIGTIQHNFKDLLESQVPAQP